MEIRFKPHAAALVLIINDNKILLLRRHNTNWANGMYTVPSGHIDEGEPASVAAIREVKEEVNVIITPDNLEFSQVIHRHNQENGQTYIDFFFIAKNWVGTPVNNEPDHCDDVQWFDLDNLPSNIIPFISEALENHKSQKSFAEIGW